MILPEPIDGDADFFRAFARFEQVLKVSGYYRRPSAADLQRAVGSPPIYPDAQPDWDRFAQERAELADIIHQQVSDPDIRYLVDHPPWHEVVMNGQLDYQLKQGEVRDAAGLLKAVRRVRNNLFHGAKTTLGPMNDPIRNRRLIQSSMAVLQAVLIRCPDIEEKFNAYDW